MRKLIFISSVFIIFLVTSCQKGKDTINDDASFPPDFKFLDMKLKVITSIINTDKNTTSVLYGNDLAFVKSGLREGKPDTGEKYVCVTWSQQSNPDWFGSRSPHKLLSVEFVNILNSENGKTKLDYKRYLGSKLTLSIDTLGQAKRTANILAQKKAIQPQL